MTMKQMQAAAIFRQMDLDAGKLCVRCDERGDTTVATTTAEIADYQLGRFVEQPVCEACKVELENEHEALAERAVERFYESGRI